MDTNKSTADTLVIGYINSGDLKAIAGMFLGMVEAGNLPDDLAESDSYCASLSQEFAAQTLRQCALHGYGDVDDHAKEGTIPFQLPIFMVELVACLIMSHGDDHDGAMYLMHKWKPFCKAAIVHTDPGLLLNLEGRFNSRNAEMN
jgi:hypothetical protein